MMSRHQIIRKIALILIIICSTDNIVLKAQDFSYDTSNAIEAVTNKLFRTSVIVSNGQIPELNINGNNKGKTYISRYSKDATQSEKVSTAIKTSTGWRIPNPESGYGYFISEDDTALPYYVFLLDYTHYTLSTKQIFVNSSKTDPCNMLDIMLDGNNKPITYYLPNGSALDVERQLRISFEDLLWNEDSRSYIPEKKTIVSEIKNNTLSIISSKANTKYHILGDRFTELWNIPFEVITSDIVQTKSVSINPQVKLYSNNNEEVDINTPVSAPATIDAYVGANIDAISTITWKIEQIRNGQKREIINYQGDNLKTTINEVGNYTIYLQVVNRDGSCSNNSFTRTFTISESELEVPNAFSPIGSPGVNDIFRVKAKSLVEFTAIIFTRDGQEIYRWNDVDSGWDGTYRGKKVPAGAYYYMIEAKGSDGKVYNKKGTVSIIGEIR